MSHREIALIDMDCFYAQVEQREKPELWGKPVIVVQHTRAGVQGGILAVSYEARKFGVKRGMSVMDAKKKCEELAVCHVPIGEHADKADIQKYRDASAEVFEVLNNFDSRIIVEKASVDEAFLDMTDFIGEVIDDEIPTTSSYPSSHIADGSDIGDYDREEKLKQWIDNGIIDDVGQKRLAIAALVVERIRREVQEKTQFFCSAGIAKNKMLAKLVCARHKPRQQTIMVPEGIPAVLQDTKIDDVRGFGGKMGRRIQESLGITTMGQLLNVDDERLHLAFPDNAEWLKRVASGWDDEPVRPRSESSSIAVSKNFPGRSAIRSEAELKEWLDGLTKELLKRIATDQAQCKRHPENLVVMLVTEDSKSQKTLKFGDFNTEAVLGLIWKSVKPTLKVDQNGLLSSKIYHLHLNASRFIPGLPLKLKRINDWLSNSVPVIAGDPPTKTCEHFIDENTVSRDVLNELPEFIRKEIESQISGSSRSTSVKENIPQEEDDDDFIEVDGEKISKKVFQELPDFIKMEYEHKIALDKARKLKQCLESSSKEVVKKGKKRPTTTQKTKEPQPKQAKTLDTFFGKKK